MSHTPPVADTKDRNLSALKNAADRLRLRRYSLFPMKTIVSRTRTSRGRALKRPVTDGPW